MVRAYAFLGVLEASAAMGAFFFVLHGAGWQWGDALGAGDVLYRQATTACLSAIVVMQVVNVLLCRSRRTSLLARPLFGNRLIWGGVAAEVALILLIDYTGPGQALFGTASIGIEVWLLLVPFAVAMILFEEARKAVVRWNEGTRDQGEKSTEARNFPGVHDARAGHSARFVP
jgi:magnesium-transporting ATPase (P-type)